MGNRTAELALFCRLYVQWIQIQITKCKKKKSKLQLGYISVYIRYVYHKRLEYNWIELILFFCFETRYFTNVYNNMYYAIPYLPKWEGGQIKSSPSPGTIKKNVSEINLSEVTFILPDFFFFNS